MIHDTIGKPDLLTRSFFFVLSVLVGAQREEREGPMHSPCTTYYTGEVQNTLDCDIRGEDKSKGTWTNTKTALGHMTHTTAMSFFFSFFFVQPRTNNQVTSTITTNHHQRRKEIDFYLGLIAPCHNTQKHEKEGVTPPSPTTLTTPIPVLVT